MLAIFQEYNAIKDNIASILKASGYRNEYVARKIGLSPANFATKKQRGNWTEKELAKIVEVITEPNEDAEDAIMVEVMRSRKDDPIVSMEEMRKELGWK